MKRSLIIPSALCLLLFAGCKDSTSLTSGVTPSAADLAASQQDSAHYTTASWSDSLQNLGTIIRGKKVQIVFHVTNTGKNPMIITSARPSCGCTVADFTKNAIAPGAAGKVTASFDSNHGMPGPIHKTIAVASNTNPVHTTLVFEGIVDEPKK